MEKNAKISEAVDELVKSASQLSKPSLKSLAKKWKQAASGHQKQATYYKRQLQFTKQKQELEMASTYTTAAKALAQLIKGNDED